LQQGVTPITNIQNNTQKDITRNGNAPGVNGQNEQNASFRE
jgi:hypothetical protein